MDQTDISIFMKEYERAKEEIVSLGYQAKLTRSSILVTEKMLPSIWMMREKERIEIFFVPEEYNDCYGFFCNECGNEIFIRNPLSKYAEHFSEGLDHLSRTYNDSAVYSLIEKLAEKLTRLSSLEKPTHCPCCGSALTYDNGYYFEFEPSAMSTIGRKDHEKRLGFDLGFKYGLDNLFQKMEHVRAGKEAEQLENKMMRHRQEWDIPVQSSADAAKVNAIKHDPIKLKEHILTLVTLENNIYAVSKRLEKLYLARVKAGRAEKGGYFDFAKGIAEAEANLEKCRMEIVCRKALMCDVCPPLKPAVPTLEEPGVFNKKKVLASNEAKQKQYQADLADYEQKLLRYEKEKQRFENEKRQKIADAEADVVRAEVSLKEAKEARETALQSAKTPAKIAVELVDTEIADAAALLKSLYECRNGLYAFDVIFGKYRNVVALSTFYEYLMAGRCTQLEGMDGAYNLYENELRASMIIERLDEIKDNQYMTYSALKAINNSLDHLENTMSTALDAIQKDVAHIAQNSDVIAHNTAVTAYYSRVNAELTNALGYMVAFK